ncbi:uncharacterized protein LOC111042237 [Myzus persicae]|uniref:uncharacterized protein LOC111042237 n=1 Tax=Myzus persicae TaxID=13164 RepID=UPI000B937998|nr:uncharacterized protein LOC111042237 [Myzus persicae]
MSLKRKKVLLLIDNCTAAHNTKKKLNSIKVEFLLPNTTSQLQPMDQAWENVEKNTIVNCFIKSGISTKEKEIKYTHLESDNGDTYPGVLSDQDIVDAVQPTLKSDSDEDEEDEYPLVVSTKEAKVSLDKLRVFIEKTEGADEILFNDEKEALKS